MGIGRSIIKYLLLFFILLPAVGSPASAAEPLRLMVLGDSLSAGYGLETGGSFPEQLVARLSARGHDLFLINASISGDTTAGGLARLDWSLADKPDAVIVALGGNDVLRGLDPAAARQNLADILSKLAERGLPVLLCGMQAPRNLGPDYAAEFDPIYAELAAEFGVLLYPFLLDGVALDPRLNLPDGMHPNKAGIAVMAEQVLPLAEALLARVQK